MQEHVSQLHALHQIASCPTRGVDSTRSRSADVLAIKLATEGSRMIRSLTESGRCSNSSTNCVRIAPRRAAVGPIGLGKSRCNSSKVPMPGKDRMRSSSRSGTREANPRSAACRARSDGAAGDQTSDRYHPTRCANPAARPTRRRRAGPPLLHGRQWECERVLSDRAV